MKKLLCVFLLVVITVSSCQLISFAYSSTGNKERSFRGTSMTLVSRGKESAGRDDVELDYRVSQPSKPMFKVKVPGNYGYSKSMQMNLECVVENWGGYNYFKEKVVICDEPIRNYSSSTVYTNIAYENPKTMWNTVYFATPHGGKSWYNALYLKMYVNTNTFDSGRDFLTYYINMVCNY